MPACARRRAARRARAEECAKGQAYLETCPLRPWNCKSSARRTVKITTPVERICCMAKSHAKEIIVLPLRKLKPHPLQKTIYRERADWQIDELAQSMAKGQNESVEVLPDHT